MGYKFKNIRLDKLNIPSETLRKRSSPAIDKKLRESIETQGILVPLIVIELGNEEYAVWDGTRRVKAMQEAGKEGSFLVPALITSGADDDSVVKQININQTRERLSNLAEAEGLRQLVKDHKWKQTDAAKYLLKTKAWASRVMRAFKLPKNMLSALRKGDIALSHAIAISKYIDKPKIMQKLFEEARKGNISHPHLTALGLKMDREGIKAASSYRPKRYKFGNKSWIRIEPLQKGMRAEIHLDGTDKHDLALKELKKLFVKINN